MKFLLRFLLPALVLCCITAGPALAQEVIAGLDFLETTPQQTFEDLSNLGGMCPGVQVIGNPVIPLRGIPLEDHPSCPGQNLGSSDTIIRRLNDTSGLNGGGPTPVPIQIVALHLQSANPFVVDNNGMTEAWMLDVTLQPAQPIGNMQIRKTHPNGGVFDSFFQVQPRLTFTRVTPCPAVVVCAVDGPIIQLQSAGVPWSYSPGPDVHQLPGCTTNFFPGVDTSFPAPGLTSVAAAQQFNEQALLVQHGVIPPPPPKLHQDDWQMAVHFDFTVTNRGDQAIDDFHIRNARYIPMDPPGSLPDPSIYIKSVSICDVTPFWPPVAPDKWCRVDWDSLSINYRKVASWHFPPVNPGETAPAMDIVFSLPCAVPPGAGAWYEVTYLCTYNCAVVDTGTFRFHCEPEPPCNDPIGCDDTPPVTGGEDVRPDAKITILQQNAPNPFASSTTLQFKVEKAGSVALNVFDAQGRLVRKLLNEPRPAGDHAVVWDGRDDSGAIVPAGAYFYQIDIGGVRQAKRMIMIR